MYVPGVVNVAYVAVWAPLATEHGAAVVQASKEAGGPLSARAEIQQLNQCLP